MKTDLIEMSDTSRRFPWLLIALALPALLVLLALGTWQVQRLAWKEALLEKIQSQLSAPAEPVASILARLTSGEINQGDLDYLPMTANGIFRHDAEQHFFATYKGISGYFVYTPLLLSAPQSGTLFVNRGFVPFDLKEAASRPQALPTGLVTIVGLARQKLVEKPSALVPDNDLTANIFYWKDIDAMALRAGLGQADVVLPFFLDAGFPDRPGALGEWPVQGVTMIDLPNNHLQYAVTWYGLALTLFIIVGLLIRRTMAAPRT